MVASESVSGAASRFKLGGSVAERIANRLKPKGPGVDDSLGSRRPSLCRMAAPDIDWDATIRSGFAGSNHSSSSQFRSTGLPWNLEQLATNSSPPNNVCQSTSKIEAAGSPPIDINPSSPIKSWHLA
ncbi:hypothetical protein Pst134EB_008037 [Puccinia striiformis f. sp. tritici]|nr:hypothetical protein Pst134EB_008037 [Puccinia striiformis f. sp. tritici]